MNFMINPLAAKAFGQNAREHKVNTSVVSFDSQASLFAPEQSSTASSIAVQPGKSIILKYQDKASDDEQCFVKGYN